MENLEIKNNYKPNIIIGINSIRVKLFLYVGVAIISSMIADLSHYTCKDSGWNDITPVHWFVILMNFVLQGLIAWRAFIDGSVYQEQEILDKEYTLQHKVRRVKKRKPRIKP